MAFPLTYKRFGERAILVEWPLNFDRSVLEDILSFKEKLLKSNIKQLIEVKTAYNSLLIVYEFFFDDLSVKIHYIEKIYSSDKYSMTSGKILWKIPVCYDAIFGIDLGTISLENKIPIQEIIKRHSQTVYTVYFIGFLPGFLYLGGLDESLFMPRKSKPRIKIEKGAVAIGGNQTGVYPQESPGGWNIIGNSPIDFFDVSKVKPCFAKAGDCIAFYPVSFEEYQNTKALVEAGVFQFESEVMHG